MTNFPFGFPASAGGTDPTDPAELQAFLNQLQQMMSSPSEGPVNWQLARQTAEQGARNQDRPLTAEEHQTAEDALRLADLWLDPVTSLPSGVLTATAWSRLDWIEHTISTWGKLCDPIAQRAVVTMQTVVPEEMREEFGPMASMLGGIGGMIFGGQVGQGLGELCTEVLATSDIGIPLGPTGTAALLPVSLSAFAQGLERPEEEVRLYVALREAAHQRLFGHVPWLRAHLFNTVDTYARGISVDAGAVGDLMGQVESADPESMRQALSGGLFYQEDTPEQRAALVRLETALALVEGWVCQVVDAAASDRLPAVAALSEAFRRRRATGGPAEQTFATLVGLELRPRRLREAATLWRTLTDERGIAGRDQLWEHPDLVPEAADLDDPVGFARRSDNGELTGFDTPGFNAPGLDTPGFNAPGFNAPGFDNSAGNVADEDDPGTA
jgi:putative hydrolase